MRLFTLIAFTVAGALGQTRFEVASVKSSPPASVGMNISTDPGRFTASNVTLKFLVQAAYHVRETQIGGGPKWFDSARYDIAAKMPARDEDYRPMLQTLLAERFQLRLHRETRMLPAFELTAVKSGMKIKEVEKGEAGARTGRGRISAKSIPLTQLAEMLSTALGVPVIDKTGAGGLFDVELKWTPDEREAMTVKPGLMPAEAAKTDSPGPSLFAALQEQLGLKLEPRTAPVEILVVDGAQAPGEN